VEALLSTITWPVLDRIRIVGDFALSPHGLGIAGGFLLGSWWVLREGPKRGVRQEHLQTMLFWALIGTIVGARFFYVLGHLSEFDSFVDTLEIYNGGISLLGGIAGAVLFAYPVMRRHHYRFLQVMDSAAVGLPFGIFIGRIGDLVIGDHLGKPTSVPWAFSYSGGDLSGFRCGPSGCTAELLQGAQTLVIHRDGATLSSLDGTLGEGVGVHQTALYDFVSVFLLFLFMYLVMSRKPRREGVLILTFAIWYGTVRIVTDFLRVDKRFFGLTGSQWTSVVVVTLAVVTLVVWALQARRRRAWAPPEEGLPHPTTAFVPPPEPSSRPGGGGV
jgi:phosphatidylglycerol---prolipoprotein diacylglyceryl transferase